MLPIYNISNTITASYTQTPSWDLLKIQDPKEKLDFLNKIKSTCVDKPILNYNSKKGYLETNFNSTTPVGVIIGADIIKETFSIKFTCLLFALCEMNFYQEDLLDETSPIEFDSISMYFNKKRIQELFQKNQEYQKILDQYKEEKEIEDKKKEKEE